MFYGNGCNQEVIRQGMEKRNVDKLTKPKVLWRDSRNRQPSLLRHQPLGF